eukprot:4584760-Prorocentrum_lima.AAC.1
MPVSGCVILARYRKVPGIAVVACQGSCPCDPHPLGSLRDRRGEVSLCVRNGWLSKDVLVAHYPWRRGSMW